MLLWFLGASLVITWAVFHDPAVDHRLVMVGAIAPDLFDAPTGGARVAHSLVFSVGLLVVVMVATIGRHSLRRHLLALPIGTFLHLVLDGVFTDPDVFWWPFSGGFDGAELASISRGWWNVPLELAGGAGLIWGWHRFGLRDPARRRRFVRTGRFDPAVSLP